MRKARRLRRPCSARAREGHGVALAATDLRREHLRFGHPWPEQGRSFGAGKGVRSPGILLPSCGGWLHPVPVGVAAWCLEWVKPEGWEEFGVPVGGDAHCPFAVVDDSVVVAA